MWEKTRVDGSRKLKFNAVPTVFDHIKEEPTDETTVRYFKFCNFEFLWLLDSSVLFVNDSNIIFVLGSNR